MRGRGEFRESHVILHGGPGRAPVDFFLDIARSSRTSIDPKQAMDNPSPEFRKRPFASKFSPALLAAAVRNSIKGHSLAILTKRNQD